MYYIRSLEKKKSLQVKKVETENNLCQFFQRLLLISARRSQPESWLYWKREHTWPAIQLGLCFGICMLEKNLEPALLFTKKYIPCEGTVCDPIFT